MTILSGLQPSPDATVRPDRSSALRRVGLAIAAAWRDWKRRTANREAAATLRTLDDRLLRDMGLTRWQAERLEWGDVEGNALR